MFLAPASARGSSPDDAGRRLRSGTRLGRLCAQSARADEGAFSRWTPSTREVPAGRASMTRRMPVSACSMRWRVSVMVVANRLVVPCEACRRAMTSIASPPSITSRAAAMDVQIDEAGQDACFTGFRRCHRAAFPMPRCVYRNVARSAYPAVGRQHASANALLSWSDPCPETCVTDERTNDAVALCLFFSTTGSSTNIIQGSIGARLFIL